jgi:hypothetical protein
LRTRTSVRPYTSPGITDHEVHAPPTSGPYAYNSFQPGTAGFPARGAAYTDPVFGSTVRRLTDEAGRSSWSDIYSKNGYWNADATMMVHNTPTGRRLLAIPTGAVVCDAVPGNDNSCFDPIDPDAWWWYYFGGFELGRYSVQRASTEVVRTFALPIGNNGGSIDWIDRTGRYMLLHLGETWQLYDVVADALYANPIPDSYGSDPGYTGITPDGNFIITTMNGNPNQHRSWAVDHAARRIATTGTVFWTLCGDHGDFVSASDGKTYMVVMECDSLAALYAVDVSLPQSHSNKQKQLSDNRQLLDLSWSDSIHASRVSRGPWADWCFVDVESGDDVFGGGVDPWRPFQQEILMVNVLTGAVRRLAHHRSRSPFTSYYYQPRISASWDGRAVAWASNMGVATPDGYADIYCLQREGDPPDPPDPPEPEPEPGRAYAIHDAGVQAVVEAATMDEALAAWRAYTEREEPASITFLADEVIHAPATPGTRRRCGLVRLWQKLFRPRGRW